MTRLVLIHTVAGNQPVFARLADELLPDVETTAIVDESLLADAITAGGLTDAVAQRLAAHVADAEAAGADAVLVTCSSVGEAVDAAAARSRIPVLRVDRPMARQAVEMGRRIGVLGTLRTTLMPTAALVEAEAAAAGRDVTVVPRLAEGAFGALKAGDLERHDALVRAAFDELQDEVDVVLLAQASMARVLDAIPEAERRVPVLSSPRSGIAQAAQALERSAARSG